ncbi:MAG: tetratricopeptide repeat protein [Planctomycetota bacterium]
MTRTWTVAAALSAVCACVSGAHAGERETWATRLVEAARAQRWEDAAQAWGRLRAEELEQPARLTFLAAQVEVARGRPAEAKDLLRELLGRSKDHLDALFLLARLEARAGELEQARALLLRGARAGQAVLRDLEVAGEEAFAPLRRDPVFLLEVMRSGSAPLEPPPRDPFARPLSAPPPPPGPDDPRGQDDRELERRLRRLLAEARRQAEARDLAPLEATLGEVRRCLAALEERREGEAKAALERLREEVAGAEELYLSLLLQVQVSRGNGLLRGCAGAVEERAWERAHEALGKLEELCCELSEVEREVFKQSARRLRLRAGALRREVELQAAIDRLELRVSGIVIPEPGDEAPRAAIVNDRIVVEGHAVEDPRSGEPSEVVLEQVGRSTLSFSLRGARFVRPLEAKPRR